MLALEVREDGGLRLLVGRLTAKWGTNPRTGEEMTFVLDVHAVAYSLLMGAMGRRRRDRYRLPR